MTGLEPGTGVVATLRATPGAARNLLAGVFINQLGAFAQTFMALYLIVRGFSVGHAGAALTAYSAGAVFGTLLGGELTHRYGPRATIVGAMTTSAVFVGSVPLLSYPGRFAALIGALVAAGLAAQTYRPAAAVLLAEVMPAQHRVMAFSMMRIALNAGAVAGPLVAAGLVLVDWNLLFWVDAATAAAYAVIAYTRLPRTPASRPATGPTSNAGQLRGYTTILHDRRYLLFLASVLLGSAVYVQYTVAVPLKITADGHPTAVYSAVLVTLSLTLILCELKITTYVRHFPPPVVGAVGTALVGVGTASYALASSPVGFVAGTLVFVFGVMVSGPTMFAYPATFPPSVRARYVGGQQAAFGLGMALGPTLGVLAWETLADGVFLLAGVVDVVAAACALVGMARGPMVPTRRPAREAADGPPATAVD